MGKQINYWMDYDSFCELSKSALTLGCIIVKSDMNTGKVVQSTDISIVTKDCFNYYFYLPSAGPLKIKKYKDIEQIDRMFNETGNAVIEAGYSRIWEEKKRVDRNRLYLTTGYYNENEEFIYRPDSIVDVYNKLARKVKKLAPYIELVDICNGKDWIHKEYVSKYCLDLRNEKSYTLFQL